VKTQAIESLRKTAERQDSTHNTPSEPQGTARQSFVFTSTAQTKVGCCSRRRAEPSGKDKSFTWSSTTLNLGLRISLIYTLLFI